MHRSCLFAQTFLLILASMICAPEPAYSAGRCESLFVTGKTLTLQQRRLMLTGFTAAKISTRLTRGEAEALVNSQSEEGLRITLSKEQLESGLEAHTLLKRDPQFAKVAQIVDEMAQAFRDSVPDGYELQMQMIQLIFHRPGSDSWNANFHIEDGIGLGGFFTAYGNRTTRYVRRRFVRETSDPVADGEDGALTHQGLPRSDLFRPGVHKYVFSKDKVERASQDELLVFFGDKTNLAFAQNASVNAVGLIHASPSFRELPLNDYRVAIGLDFVVRKKIRK